MKYVKKYTLCCLGCLLMAIAINGFISPHGFVTGGFGGLAIAIHHLIDVPIGTLIIILNIPLFMLAFLKEGKEFIIDAVITTLILGVITDFLSFMPILCDDVILSALFGGVIEGIGVGICYRSRMSSGGTELLARLILHKMTWMTPGQMLMILSAVVITLATLATQSYTLVYYSIIEFFVSGKVSDVIIVGGDQAKMCQVITTYPEEIRNHFLEKTYRGMTLSYAKGCYSNEEKAVLMSVLSPRQVQVFVDTVKSIDQHAFVIISDVNQVLGKGFKGLK
ncbi:YitT family protein [Candidatus Stoquefichus massiliensis]|uniref:YitT family protein n=1 Tax=Candidatus Stoquefichus massiliensis TaxID=1470350 RepID=UPI00048627B8|nr:YitT family protein [Candidatus Stoquefichus massiliensis]